MENLHRRIERLEREIGLSVEDAEDFAALFRRMHADENRNIELHTNLINCESGEKS